MEVDVGSGWGYNELRAVIHGTKVDLTPYHKAVLFNPGMKMNLRWDLAAQIRRY